MHWRDPFTCPNPGQAAGRAVPVGAGGLGPPHLVHVFLFLTYTEMQELNFLLKIYQKHFLPLDIKKLLSSLNSEKDIFVSHKYHPN